MTLLSTSDAIRNAINELKPRTMAVAYVGAGWENYLDTSKLRTLVVSPTGGTNP